MLNETATREIANRLADHLSDATPEQAADAMLNLIANTVASLIDAGSERDAVNENDILRNALLNEFQGWYTPKGWRP